MKTLPENILKCMPKEQREPLGKGFKTSAEAVATFETKNERQVQKHIANYLRQHSIWFSQSRTDKRTTNGNGTPDFLFSALLPYNDHQNRIYPIAIEVKFGDGKLSKEQEDVRGQMVLNGWCYFVVHSLQEVIAILAL